MIKAVCILWLNLCLLKFLNECNNLRLDARKEVLSRLNGLPPNRS